MFYPLSHSNAKLTSNFFYFAYFEKNLWSGWSASDNQQSQNTNRCANKNLIFPVVRLNLCFVCQFWISVAEQKRACLSAFALSFCRCISLHFVPFDKTTMNFLFLLLLFLFVCIEFINLIYILIFNFPSMVVIIYIIYII